MHKKTYKHLNKVQKGSFGESYARMMFTLEGFEVYNSEYDDRGIDFVVRNTSGKFFIVQVKTTDNTVNPFIYEDNFMAGNDFIFCAVRIIENEEPSMFLALGSDWEKEYDCLNYNPEGGASGPYYEIRFAKKYKNDLETFDFMNYVNKIKS